MSTRRFFCPRLDNDLIRLDADQSRHARKVLRLTPGDAVELFDGSGTLAIGRIEGIDESVIVRIQRRDEASRARPWIDLATAIPKGDRAAVLIEKAAELGADRLIPLLCERSVVEPGGGKVERFERIAVSAAKQCGRLWMMRVDPPTTLADLLTRVDHDRRLMADPDGAAAGVQEMLTAERLIVIIGPEGGWTAEERNAAISAGFVPWRFSANTLRTETAALASLAILRAAR